MSLFDDALRAEGVTGHLADIARSIYEQESGSGRNTRTSSAGARGGMQILPGTFQEVADEGWDIDDPSHNARAGIRYLKKLYARADGDAFLTAAGYYGGPGGMDKAREGVAVSDPRNPKAPTTLQYAQQVAARVGKRESDPDAIAPKPKEGPYSGDGEAIDWPVVPRYRADQKNALRADLEPELAQHSTVLQQGADPARSYAALEQRNAAVQADLVRRANTGFSEAWDAARTDIRLSPTLTILDHLDSEGRPDTTPIPGYYEARRDELEAGLPHEHRLFLRENVHDEATERWAMAQVQMRMDAERVYADAGGLAAFAAQAGWSMLDPVAFAGTLGIGKVLHLGAVAAFGGRSVGRAAGAAVVAEGALGNVAVEALHDTLGEVKGVQDYVMAGAIGSVLSAPFARGAAARAASQAAEEAARRIQATAVEQQARQVADYLARTGETDPIRAARAIEAEQLRELQDGFAESAPGQKIREQVMPEDVVNDIRVEYENPDLADPPPVERPAPSPAAASPDAPEPIPEPVDLKAAEDPALRQEPIVSGPDNWPTIDTTALDALGSGSRDLPAADGGAPVHLTWMIHDKAPATGTTARDVIDAMLDPAIPVPPSTRALASYLKEIIGDAVADVSVTWRGRFDRGLFNPNTQGVELPGGHLDPLKGAKDQLRHVSPWHYETALHEIIHAASHAKIAAFEIASRQGKLDSLPAELRQAAQDLKLEFDHFKAMLNREFPPKPFGSSLGPNDSQPAGMGDLEYRLRYASKNLHEFTTMAMSDPQVQAWMAARPGLLKGQGGSLWRSFVDAVGRMLTRLKGNKLESATAAIDRLLRADGSSVKYLDGSQALYSPAPQGVRERTRRRWAERMYQHAEQYLQRNPINTDRLKVLTRLIGGVSDGLVLASSKNPIMQMVASLVTETTTGAAGRKATVAIRTSMLDPMFMGNALRDYNAEFAQWNRTNGGTVWDTAVVGDQRRRFDREVYLETLSRRRAGYQPTGDANVRAAADALEQVFERARKAQVAAGTLGSQNLPQTSRGYMPQALDGKKLQTLSVAELHALHTTLGRQFQERMGWDEDFANTFAEYYTARVRKRAQGVKDQTDALAGGGDAMTTVRDTLEDMIVDPTQRDRMTAATNARAGLGQTKRRLDLDLTEEFLPGRPLLDVYSTDSLNLARTYSRRTAGHVALTESGILGIRGVRELKEAATVLLRDGTQPTKEELDAFDRVFSEILGTPVAGQVVSAGATNLRLLTSLQRLGGLAFTQAAEQWNALHHLGLRSTMALNSSVITKMLAEVGRLKKGQPSGNNILTSMETYGGEFGMDSYKMVMPLDPPDRQIEQYMEQAGLVSRLLRAGSHLQAKISFFRGLMAAQHRAAAEQITMKAARLIRDGGDDVALADMGFTPQLIAAMREDLPNVAQFDSRGKLVSWDITQVRDPANAEAFVQSVHRGVSQIIQGTFVGERNKWLHNDYLKLALQLRTFGLTATEKQLGRTAMLHGGGTAGYAYAGGVMLGQMVMAMPLYLARVHLAASGREDRDKFLKEATSPGAMVVALMNYSSMSGSAGDILDLVTALNGWLDDDTKEMIGARTGQATSIGRLVPAFGSIDAAFKVVGGQSSLYTAIKQLPFSNLPYLQPWIGMTKE